MVDNLIKLNLSIHARKGTELINEKLMSRINEQDETIGRFEILRKKEYKDLVKLRE